MEIKICVLTVACVACLVPQAQGLFFGPHLASLAAAKGAVLKAGVNALAVKGSMIGGAILGAKTGALAAVYPPPPPPHVVVDKPVIHVKPPHGMYVKPVEVKVPQIPSVADKVSGFWSILRSAIHNKTELVSNLVTSLHSPPVTAKPVIYEIVERPKFYPVPVYPQYDPMVAIPPFCDDKK